MFRWAYDQLCFAQFYGFWAEFHDLFYQTGIVIKTFTFRCMKKFEIYTSEFVVAELSQGDPEAAARRLVPIEDIPELDVTEEVRHLGKAIVAEGPIPEQSTIDAYHIAVAAVNGMDYLITWNCTHIANAVMRPQIEAVCRNNGFEPPIICTPQELMEG